ncbi:MAG: carbohydrate kinase [Treponema sp.]|jgi:sugar (pentulose or hexulose) kinase|nr:carbohydrate kinase [Treponema sp.]
MNYSFVSCDCGNSSTRVTLCRYDGRVITTRVILQEPNDACKRGAYFYWDIMQIFAYLKKGIALAARETDRINSIGICTWGIDFALFDENMHMLADPLCYRNTLGKEELDKLPRSVQDAMFYRTGILSDRINTVFMLKGIQSKMPELMMQSKKLLLIPDLLNYFFTGRCYSEVSEASTTQLFDVRAGQYSGGQCAALGIDPGLFFPAAEHGTSLGLILPEIRRELHIGYDIPVVCVASHDTASAVMGAPAEEETFAFISAGTWALIGLHCKEPFITEAALRRGFTNEAGAFGHITLLKNSIGLFIFQRLRAGYASEDGREMGWSEFEDLAEAYAGPELLFDVNHADFFNPPGMDEAVGNYLSRTGQLENAGRPAAVSAARTSLAASFVRGIRDAGSISGLTFPRIVIVGGGARSRRLMQMTADISGMEVAACGMECTSIGNALAQAAFVCGGLSYGDLRSIAAASLDVQRYIPQSDKSGLLDRYGAIQHSS